jgi:hypothetical protein
MGNDAQVRTTVPAHSVLVVYGVPPRMRLSDAAGREVGTFSLKDSNRESFEAALRSALATFVGTDASVSGARFVFIRNSADFAAAVRSAQYAHVIYYGHALLGENVLLPTANQRITTRQLAQALAGTSINHFDILGCRSASLAAELSTLLPKIRVGNLRSAREDNVEADPRTLQVIRLMIDRQPVFHFEAAAR